MAFLPLRKIVLVASFDASEGGRPRVEQLTEVQGMMAVSVMIGDTFSR